MWYGEGKAAYSTLDVLFTRCDQICREMGSELSLVKELSYGAFPPSIDSLELLN